MILIACDPATKECAFAVFRKGKLLRMDKLQMKRRDILAYFRQFKNFGLAIELQYSYLNTKTLIKLVEARRTVEMLALQAGCKYIYNIQPSVWQKSLSNRKMLRDEIKKLSMEKASKIAKVKITDSDIADAVCIGEFVLNNFEKLETIEIP